MRKANSRAAIARRGSDVRGFGSAHDTSVRNSAWRPHSIRRKSRKGSRRSDRRVSKAMVNNIFLLAGSFALAMGGLAFVVLGGDSRADQRRMAIAKTDTKARATTIDRAAKKKQITESLRELEKNSKRK